MDFTSLIEIVLAVVVIYFVIKFIISPVLKVIIGIIIVAILIYLLQRFFGFNIDNALAPFGISVNISKWGSGFSWILGPIDYFVDQIINFLRNIWNNFSKT